MREVLNEKTIVLNFFFDKNDTLPFDVKNLEFNPDEVVLKHFIVNNSTKYTVAAGPPIVDDRGFMYILRTDMIDTSKPFHTMKINSSNDPNYIGYPEYLHIPFPIRSLIRDRDFNMELKNYNGSNINIADADGLQIYISITFTFIKYK